MVQKYEQRSKRTREKSNFLDYGKKTLKISWTDKIRNEDVCGVGRMKRRVDTENGEKKSEWNI